MRRFLASLCCLIAIANVGLAQSPFQNLDFETIIPIDNTQIDLGGEFPGWDFGSITSVTHTGPGSHLFLGAIPDDSGNDAGNTPEFDLSVAMAAGYETLPGSLDLVDPLTGQGVGISQTGLVPVTSRSIRLLASSGPTQELFFNGSPTGVFDTQWTLSLGGNELSLFEISPGEWAGNFPGSLAGTSQALSIDMTPDFGIDSSVTPDNLFFRPAVYFDNISFSNEVVGVPEPGSTLILLAGLLGLATRRRKEWVAKKE